MTMDRRTTCASRRKATTAALSALAVCVLSCALAMSAHAPAFGAGSSAETEVGVVFIEEPEANDQGRDPAEPDHDQGSQEGLRQEGAASGLLAAGRSDGSYWLQTTGDAMGRASAILACVAAVSALACLVAASRIGKEARHVR